MEHQGRLGVCSHQKQAHEGAAILLCQLPPAGCAGQALPCQPHLGTDRQIRPTSNPKTNPPQASALFSAGLAVTGCLILPSGTGLVITLKCISLFWSTGGLQDCCTIRLRADCFQKTTIVLLLRLIQKTKQNKNRNKGINNGRMTSW